ncbi:hypothetical protein AVEN_803-1 [Araneus ventricosus]|uniref:Uncharacterized protein n=1 Tax=Araneus ventricosus TaxID=182803 RepID=A0A4Y2Q6B2_ARAVE|nr:hypothetical protein AVEN_803-1 [Araneus ventricosus]
MIAAKNSSSPLEENLPLLTLLKCPTKIDVAPPWIVKKLKDFIEKLEDGELREILSHLPPPSNTRCSCAETWDKVRNFKDLKHQDPEHSKKFEWVKDMWVSDLTR